MHTHNGELGKKISIDSRIRHIVVIILAMAIVLAGKLFIVQVVQAKQLSQVAREFRTRSYIQEAVRGDITDTNGVVLASSISRYALRVDQKAIAEFVHYNEDEKIIGTGAAAAAKILAPKLKRNQAELGGELLGGAEKNQYKLIARGLTPDEWREIKALNIYGIFGEHYIERIYPNGTTAGTVIGYVGQTAQSSDLAGRSGIEQQFDKVLRGKSGKLIVEVGPDGTIFPQSKTTNVPAVNGNNVKLSLDIDIQTTAENSLHDLVGKTGAYWGALAAIEIGTGRILALADTNYFNPGNLETEPVSYTNFAIGNTFEPGSTGKVLTLSSAINENKVHYDDVYTNAYTITMPNGETFKNYAPHPEYRMTVAGLITRSYNTGLVQIGDLIDDNTRYDYFQKFGFGKATGIELPAEETGLLRTPDQWDQRSHYTTMFGQAYTVTALQLAQVGAVLGNKGVYQPVTIIDEYVDENGVPTVPLKPNPHQVVSPETAREVLDILQGVTQVGGGAPKAAVEGYNVAGKTGTAEILAADGSLRGISGTFLGVIPAEDPKVAIAISVFAPSPYDGGNNAPVFAATAKMAMQKLMITPSTVPLVTMPWLESDLG